MPKVYKVWYNQTRATYNKLVRLLRDYRWSDGSRITKRDIRPFASSLMLWHAMLVDFGVSFATAGKWLVQVLGAYSSELDYLFEDLGSCVQMTRHTAGWQEIVDWWLADRRAGRLALLQIWTYFPMWRTDPWSFRKVHGMYQFLVKQTFDRERLGVEAYDAYVQGEESILQTYDDFGEWCIWQMQDTFRSWFKDWEPSTIAKYLKFSAGTVADEEDGKDLRKKIQRLNKKSLTPNLLHVIRRDLPEFAEEMCWDEGCGESEPYDNEIRFVPKTALKKRVIGMEHAIVNFFQNGLDGSIRHSRSFPKHHLRLDDQGYSRELAQRGSRSGNLATLDYSAASDSVSLYLIRRLTADCDYRLIQWLEATRSGSAHLLPIKEESKSKRLLREERWITLKKFAAMGSVVCFTIESLVFLAIALLACRLAGVDPALVAVYGDDVIVPVEAVPFVRQISAALGFKLNDDKSFSSGPFREACGVFAFNGINVTTPNASRKRHDFFALIKGKDEDVRSYLVATNLANECFDADLGYTRYICVRHLIDNGVRFLSGNAGNAPCGVVIHAKRDPFKPLWYDTVAPRSPLFILSDYVGLRAYEPHTGDWIEEAQPHRFVRKVAFKTIVQTYKDGGILPTPDYHVRRFTVEDSWRLSYPTEVGKREYLEEYTDEQRLENWLYRSRFERRQPLHDFEGIDLPFEEPLTAERGFGVLRFVRTSKHVAV